jgi:hypothetical protein
LALRALQKARISKNWVLRAKLIILHARRDGSSNKSSDLKQVGRAQLDEFTSISARFGAHTRPLGTDAERYPRIATWIREMLVVLSKNECAEAV